MEAVEDEYEEVEVEEVEEVEMEEEVMVEREVDVEEEVEVETTVEELEKEFEPETEDMEDKFVALSIYPDFREAIQWHKNHFRQFFKQFFG